MKRIDALAGHDDAACVRRNGECLQRRGLPDGLCKMDASQDLDAISAFELCIVPMRRKGS